MLSTVGKALVAPAASAERRFKPHKAARPTRTGAEKAGAQTGGTATGRGEPKGAEQTSLPRAQRGARPSGRATGQAAGRWSGWKRRRAGDVLPSRGLLALFPAFFGLRWDDWTFDTKKRPERRKNAKKGLPCVEQCDILVLRRV